MRIRGYFAYAFDLVTHMRMLSVMNNAESQTVLDRVIATLGTQSELVRVLGLSQSTVNSWFRRGQELPAQHVLKVEAATGISRHELRPDLYPREDSNTAHRPGGQPSAGSLPPADGSSSSALEGVRA